MDEDERRAVSEELSGWEPEGLENADEVAEDLLELPPGAQFGVLRTAIPRILGPLPIDQREGFLRVLRDEIERVALGEEVYDVRAPGARGEHRARRKAALYNFLAGVSRKLHDHPPPRDLLSPTAAVLRVLGSRITDDEFDNLLAQLPKDLRDRLEEDPPPITRPRSMDASAFIGRVAEGACDGDRERAFELSAAVLRTLTERIGNAAVKARRQLPIDYLPLFQELPAEPPPGHRG